MSFSWRLKVVGDANETTGHGLSEEEIKLSVDVEIDGDPRDAAERKWTLGGGIEVPCIYRFYGPKKSIAEFSNKLGKYINMIDNKLILLYLVVVFLDLDSKKDMSHI